MARVTRAAQLALGLSLKDDATFENFYFGNNAEIVTQLKLTAKGLGERVIYLCGSRGEGCSHLLQACCHEAHQAGLSSVYLPLAQLSSYSPDVLNGFESLQLVCLDDVHEIAGREAWEEAIFHLYNRVYDAGGCIVMAAHDLPKYIHLQLPDLVSRFSYGMVFQLSPLTDEEKLAALTMRAHRRGMTLPEEVGKYLLTHRSRQMGALFDALDQLDKASLALKRRLTIPFVKEVVAE